MMTATLTTGGDTSETTTECWIPVVKSAGCGQQVWDGFFSAARLVIIWSIMLGLPLVYEKRLADHSWNLGEHLALATGGVAVHVFDESDLQVSKRFVRRCVLEWRVFATINVVILGLATALLPVLNGQFFTRTFLYSTFACGLLAFVIGSVYSVHLEHVQDTQECSLWLLRASRNDLLIKFSVFLALPLTWSVWGILLFTTSLVSFIWTYPGDPTQPSVEGGNMESILETWRIRWITLPTVLLVVGLWNFWLLWMVFAQLSKIEIDAPPIQVSASRAESTVLEHPGPCVL